MTTEDKFYLDCFDYGPKAGVKSIGQLFPAQTYGPASKEDVEALQSLIGKSFTRTEVVETTKGLSPVAQDRWPKRKE